MASKLCRISPYEAENPLEVSLRQAFDHLQSQLNPPFSLAIPSPTEYSQLNRAILYAILTQQSQFTKTHITHLSAIVTDGYQLFLNLLCKLVLELYPKLFDHVKAQLICITWKMVEFSGVGVEDLLICLMRYVVGGDFSDENLCLSMELIRVLMGNWEWLVERPLVVASGLFCYLRLLVDHCRVSSGSEFEVLKRIEIHFCVKVLRNHFDLCLGIGRDLIRLLKDLNHVPEFQSVYNDMLLNPFPFRAFGFSNISEIYMRKTPVHYHLLRISPEMETKLRFLLTHVKWGNYKRYRMWFSRKFFSLPDSDIIIPDIVRFICCVIHPPNEIIQSDIIPRWAIIGWLLKCCRKNHVENGVKLALFYDWLFFDDAFDNVMNIEPGILLMVKSIPEYVDITRSLLEFLFLQLDNFDVERKNAIVWSVSTAFHVLVRKGVVDSLDVLTSCNHLSHPLKQRLSCLVSRSISKDIDEEMTESPPQSSLSPLELPCLSNAKSQKLPISELRSPTICSVENGFDGRVNASLYVLDSPSATHSIRVCSSEGPLVFIDELVKGLGEAAKMSKEMGLQILEKILFSFVNPSQYSSLDATIPVNSSFQPEELAHQVADAFKSNGDCLFDPFTFQLKYGCDDKIQSSTALIICTHIFSQHRWMQDMIIFWLRNGYSVGPWFLFYASTIAFEVDQKYCSRSQTDEEKSTQLNYSKMPFLKYHIDKYISFMRSQKKDFISGMCESMVELKLVLDLVEDAFVSYIKLLQLRNASSEESHKTLSKLLFSDLHSCCEWDTEMSKPLFRSIFCYLSDLSTGKEEFIRLLINQVDHSSLVALQFDICLKRFSLFGLDTEVIFSLIKNSLSWGFVEQQKLWGLMISELAVSNIHLEKLIMKILYLDILDPSVHSTAIEGLFTLCSRRAPVPELVGTVLSLPNDNYGEFSAAVLASWVVSNGSALFSSLVEYLEQINKDGDQVLGNSMDVMIKQSCISKFLNFLNKMGIENTYHIGKMSVDIHNLKDKLVHAAVGAGKQLIS